MNFFKIKSGLVPLAEVKSTTVLAEDLEALESYLI